MQVISKQYEDFVEQDFERYVKWHRRALEQPPEQYQILREMLAKIVPVEQNLSLLNLCAGNGNLIVYLNQKFSHWNYVGSDTVKRLIEDESTTKIQNKNIKLFPYTIEEIQSQYSNQFDLVVHFMRLLHFEDWREHIKTAVCASKKGGHIFISSLFNSFDVDLLTLVCDYNIPACSKGYCLQYNTFSAAEVERYCQSLDVREIHFTPFEISFDIPRKAEGVGSYTVRTKDGHRLTISAGMLMQWQILHIVV
ncbi:methyltransferase domain-containing protein [Lusitaniella coriacea]|uniref:methyltransferase domain-containing protein n=1 Tax=Lusitaniella coriacea TaxID=1983105 RepID=UPI003CF59762